MYTYIYLSLAHILWLPLFPQDGYREGQPPATPAVMDESGVLASRDTPSYQFRLVLAVELRSMSYWQSGCVSSVIIRLLVANYQHL